MSTLRLGILTTDTLHHRYFLRRLSRELPSGVEIAVNLFEEKPYPWRRNAMRYASRHWYNPLRAWGLNPYIQSRRHEVAQSAYEAAAFFPDGEQTIPEDYPTHRVYSVNDVDAKIILEDARPDLLLVYGTGLVAPAVYQRPRLGAINAHGGLLPGYRGLDTNLWATLEGSPNHMAVTIHTVEKKFDTGAIVEQARLGPRPDLSLASLRYHTAILCTDLFLEAVRRYADCSVTATPQEGSSRYYGPMPALMKRRADRLLRRYATTARTEQP